MAEKRIMTLHPAGKKGVHIQRSKYDLIKETILSIVKRREEVTLKDLSSEARRSLEGKFDGKVTWYVVSVKLDLEARGILKRINGRPHKVKINDE